MMVPLDSAFKAISGVAELRHKFGEGIGEAKPAALRPFAPTLDAAVLIYSYAPAADIAFQISS